MWEKLKQKAGEFATGCRRLGGEVVDSIKRNARPLVAGGAAAVSALATMPGAVAQEFDAAGEVGAIVTNANSLLGSIYPIVVTAVAFGILVGLVKMIKKR